MLLHKNMACCDSGFNIGIYYSKLLVVKKADVSSGGLYITPVCFNHQALTGALLFFLSPFLSFCCAWMFFFFSVTFWPFGSSSVTDQFWALSQCFRNQNTVQEGQGIYEIRSGPLGVLRCSVMINGVKITVPSQEYHSLLLHVLSLPINLNRNLWALTQNEPPHHNDNIVFTSTI